jgi:hypothetical protein
MKKIVLSLVAIACSASVVFAQNYEDTRNLLYLKQYKKAKEQLDKNWTNAKFTAKPEAYILKANVLAGLATDSSLAAQAPQYRIEAREALAKYKELDPKLTLVAEQGSIYSTAPISLYSDYFNNGISAFRKKDWTAAFEDFTSTLDLFEILKATNLTKAPIDTNSLLFAGASAQSLKKDDVAETYFVKLADAKVGGSEYEFVYQFLTTRYLAKGEITKFNKYLALGKEIYPDSKYFQHDELDYILSIEDAAEKNRLIEQRIASNPTDGKTYAAYGEILFDQLNPKDGEPALGNYDENETKMVNAFEKAGQIEPTNGLYISNLGNHFINKSNRLAKQLDSIRTVIREKIKAAQPAAPKPGTKPVSVKADPADAALRDELNKKYEEASEKARQYYEKAANIYSQKSTLASMEKQQYRNAVGYLIDLSAEKKNNSKGTPALYDKWEKEEKKWSELYHKMQ